MQCVHHIMGAVPPALQVLPIQAKDDPARKEMEARALVAQLDSGGGVLLLTDVFGATPCNIASRLVSPGRIVGVAGVNLPMLLRAVNYRDRPATELAQLAALGGRECIVMMDQENGHDVKAGCANH